MRCECKSPVPVSHWFAEGQNHRAEKEDLVCCACGGGVQCTPEEYAATEAADRKWFEDEPLDVNPEVAR